MNLKRIVLIALPLALIVIVAAAYLIFQSRTYTIYVDEAAIQDAIDGRLPHSREFLLILRLDITEVDLDLADGSDTVDITATAVLNVHVGDQAQQLGGTITARSRFRYDQDAFAVYLVDPVIERVHIQGIPERYTDAVSTHAHHALQYLATSHPVYQITDGSLKTKLVRAVLKDASVRNGRLVITLGY